jgi:ABC-2 type transport system permease protein
MADFTRPKTRSSDGSLSFASKLRTVLVFVKINTLRTFRDKTALFFTFVFPLIFLFIFGGIFGDTSNVSFNVALVNESKAPFASQFAKDLQSSKVFKVSHDVTSLEQSKEKMKRGELDATIVLPPDFGAIKDGKAYPSGQAQIYYTQNSATAGQTITPVLEGVFKGINQRYVQTDTPFTVASKQLNEKALTSFDYTFAGLLGFAIIGLGIFGPINVFPELKKQGILRRLHTTPLRVWQYFLSNMLSAAVVGLMTIAVMFVVAISVFHLKVVGNWLELAVFVVLGIVAISGIGLALGGWAKNERQAAPVGNLVSFPLMFLSGTFFPRFLMPEWLQNVSAFLPLTPVIDGIRLIATEGQHLANLLPQLGLLAAWIVVIYAIAFRVFRWE